MKTVSVVIPTLNEERAIGPLLNAIRGQDHPVCEVIVVDAGSTDGTATVVGRFAEVRFVRSRPPVGAQRQVGLEAATGDVVFFLDADTLPSRSFVGECVRAMESRRLAAACPRYVPHPGSPAISAVYAVFNAVFFLLQRFLASGAGSGMIADREFAIRIGGFRSDLVYEDIEFLRRASRRGRFGSLATPLLVSDRRFRECGVVRMLMKYLFLSFFFTFGLFKLASRVRYPFAMYQNRDTELVVLVDEQDRPIGTAPKDGIHGQDTPLHRGFSLFILNDRGEVLLQQRSGLKPTWPLEWSNSCCGHPLPGEAVESAARRRAHYELGLTLDEVHNVLPDFRYRAEKDGIVENETCPVLVSITDQQPVPNPCEVEQVEWVEWSAFVASLETRTDISPWCREEVALLQESPDFRRLLHAAQSGTRLAPA